MLHLLYILCNGIKGLKTLWEVQAEHSCELGVNVELMIILIPVLTHELDPT